MAFRGNFAPYLHCTNFFNSINLTVPCARWSVRTRWSSVPFIFFAFDFERCEDTVNTGAQGDSDAASEAKQDGA